MTGFFVRHGMIDANDLALFDFVDDPPTALKILQRNITPVAEPSKPPDFAHSRVPPEVAA